jgi:hypothetical protein
MATSRRQEGYAQYELQMEPGCWAQEAVGCRKGSSVTSKNFPISDQSPRNITLGEHRCIHNLSSIFRFFRSPFNAGLNVETKALPPFTLLGNRAVTSFVHSKHRSERPGCLPFGLFLAFFLFPLFIFTFRRIL